MAWELELRSALEGKRKKRGLTSGSHAHPDKYLGDASRTVRRHLADCPRGGCYSIDTAGVSGQQPEENRKAKLPRAVVPSLGRS